MQTPESITPHEPKYNANAWKDYTLQELGSWVHLLAKRATMRSDAEKKAKDLYDANNYLAMMQAHLDSLRNCLHCTNDIPRVRLTDGTWGHEFNEGPKAWMEPCVSPAWPSGIDFSMAPFGYVVSAHKTDHSETSVGYKCDKCPFSVSVDPRDMTLAFVQGLMRQHIDEAH